jgi:hypothetical protein
VAGDGVIVFDPKDEHAAFGIGETGHIARHLIAHLLSIAGLLFARRPLKQRFAIEMLPFVLGEEGRCIKQGHRAHQPTASSSTWPSSSVSWIAPSSRSNVSWA